MNKNSLYWPSPVASSVSIRKCFPGLRLAKVNSVERMVTTLRDSILQWVCLQHRHLFIVQICYYIVSITNSHVFSCKSYFYFLTPSWMGRVPQKIPHGGCPVHWGSLSMIFQLLLNCECECELCKNVLSLIFRQDRFKSSH